MKFIRQFFPFDLDTMLISVALWMCTLPLVALIVAPLFGKGTAMLTALVLFIIILLICWGICGWKVYFINK